MGELGLKRVVTLGDSLSGSTSTTLTSLAGHPGQGGVHLRVSSITCPDGSETQEQFVRFDGDKRDELEGWDKAEFLNNSSSVDFMEYWGAHPLDGAVY